MSQYTPEAFVAELRTVLENVQTELSATGRHSARIQRCIEAMPWLDATLRQQAARVDEHHLDCIKDAYRQLGIDGADGEYRYKWVALEIAKLVDKCAALEAALSAQPASDNSAVDALAKQMEMDHWVNAANWDDTINKTRATFATARERFPESSAVIDYVARELGDCVAFNEPAPERQGAVLASIEARLRIAIEHGDTHGWQTARNEIDGILGSYYFTHPAAPVGVATAAQVDWLIAHQSRLIVRGLHPEDARLWMQSMDLNDFDFATDPVAAADAVWMDHFADPDVAPGLSQAFVDRVTQDPTDEPPVMGAAHAAPVGVLDGMVLVPREMVAEAVQVLRNVDTQLRATGQPSTRIERAINALSPLAAAPSAPQGTQQGEG